MNRRFNVIMIFSPDGTKLLFCRRTKEPFRGKFNMVGGHIEPGETDEEAAYRELCEESGIGRDAVCLTHVMDFIYRTEELELQVWAGQLSKPVPLREEENPLFWLDETENYFDADRFAGNGNIGHILREVLSAGIIRKTGKGNSHEA